MPNCATEIFPDGLGKRANIPKVYAHPSNTADSPLRHRFCSWGTVIPRKRRLEPSATNWTACYHNSVGRMQQNGELYDRDTSLFMAGSQVRSLLTHSIEHSPSWEANRFSGSQEIPRIITNPKVHYRIHKCSPPVPTLSQIYPVHTPIHPTSWGSILILSFHLCLVLPSGLFPSGFPTKTLYTPLWNYLLVK